jgi:hypothetical protein
LGGLFFFFIFLFWVWGAPPPVGGHRGGGRPPPPHFRILDRGSQYVAMRYTERLAAAGAAPSVGSVGDAYDCEYPAGGPPPRLTPVMTNALAESVIGLYCTRPR